MILMVCADIKSPNIITIIIHLRAIIKLPYKKKRGNSTQIDYDFDDLRRYQITKLSNHQINLLREKQKKSPGQFSSSRTF
jgi:hypothetical protein